MDTFRNDDDGRESDPRPTRKHPPHGVLFSESRPTIIFLTVCAKNRAHWLANPTVHSLLRETWLDANAWLVGRYVVMPDHIHLFASPAQFSICLEDWIQFWKSRVTKAARRLRRLHVPPTLWQTDHWDTRLRNLRMYEEKWDYIRNNPVRHGLVAHAEYWPYQGEIHRLAWD